MIEKISVIMACYHADTYTYLKEAFNSIFAQSYPIHEIVVVINGKIHNDIELYFNTLLIKYSNLIFIRLDSNQGAAIARNIGMQNSSGDYIAIMDSDDIMHPDRIQRQIECIKKFEVDAVWSWQEEFYDNTNRICGLKRCPEKHYEILQKLKYRNLLPDPSTFIKRECYEKTNGYDEKLINNYDYKFFLNMLLNGFTFHCIQTPLIKVRVSKKQRRRRGGLTRMQQDFILRKWMLTNGFINSFEMFWTMCMYTVFRLQPNLAREIIYKYILRRN